jgi:hypothetical protein
VELDLAGTRVNDAGVAMLSQLRHLEQLDLSGTQLTDAAIDALARLTKLRRLRALDLADTEISDASIEALASLVGLATLDLAGTEMSEAGVDELRRALPGCAVEMGRRVSVGIMLVAGRLVYDATELRVITLNEGETIDIGDVTIAEGAR